MKRLVLVVLLALSAGSLLSVTSLAAPTLSDHAGPGLTPVSETVNGNGTVTDSWMYQGTQVNATGPRGMTVNASVVTVHGHRMVVVASSPPAQAKTQKPDHNGVYPWAGWCVNLRATQGGGGTAKGCDYQEMLYRNGSDWYISDSLSMTAQYGHGIWDYSLRYMYNFVAWSKNNLIVKWSPTSSSIPVGNCQNTSVGVSFYVNISEQWTVCPDTWGIVTGTSNTNFGAYWSGQSQSARGVDSVDVDHNPPNAIDNPVLYTGMEAW